MRKLLIILALTGTVNLSDVSYYEVLGVTKKASTQEIRQAYKKLAIKLHPDKNPDAGEKEHFLKITEAYETLKDPDKKRQYDLYGSFKTYSRKYDYHSQTEYDNLYYNGLYHNDPFVETLSGKSFYNFLKDGFYFVNFYSPFCPPCQSVADHWKKLAELYKGIIKVGAVNCKYHNSFCYNSMRIGSYPTLLFYPNGKDGNYIYYGGDRTLEALEEFVMKYIRNKIHVPTVTLLKGTDTPMAYVLGENRIERNALTRIAYHLNGLVTVAVVTDENLRSKLTENDYTTVVFRYRGTTKEIEITDETNILKEVIGEMPTVELIDPDKLKKIRNSLRSGAKTPWVLYFSTKEADRLEFYQTRISMANMNFGEIDCSRWSELCASLQVEAESITSGSWAVLKVGGAYQLVDKLSLPTAAEATNLHTLSPAELHRILHDNVGTWVLLVVPYKLSWRHLSEPFTQASLHFVHSDINFGITSCSSHTDRHCRNVATNVPTILVQNGTKRAVYAGRADQWELVEFITLLKDTSDMMLSEEDVLSILDAGSREHTWLVAHLPAKCGRFCEQLTLEWMKVYNKLQALDFVRVGVLDCGASGASAGGFCANIRAPTARLYPLAAGHHYSINLQQVTEAPYILEWALEHIDDSLVKLNWHSFSKHVLAEELNPSSNVKPWLVYFHSPRCRRCYEMYADFAIAGILLKNTVHLGKVNCLTDRGLCQNEQISSYPSLKLYLNRNLHQRFSSVVAVQLQGYSDMLDYVRPHVSRYNGNMGMAIGVKHDEF